MAPWRASPGRDIISSLVLRGLPSLYILCMIASAHALAQRPRSVLDSKRPFVPSAAQRQDAAQGLPQQPLEHASWHSLSSINATLRDLLDALDVMQDSYFELWKATWPTSIDWTAAVLGTHVSATLSSLTSTPDEILAPILSPATEEGRGPSSKTARNALAFENLINHYFDHTQAFYFGENAFGLRNQAYDDMLWVVLDWLENIKFQDVHSDLRYDSTGAPWHGTQFRTPAAHRARLFYELAAQGWDNSLCEGGMIWSPHVTPYKNAITNELFIAASIGMYLYFPGDPIGSPFVAQVPDSTTASNNSSRHNPAHLAAAVRGYQWLKDSNMVGVGGLYADGFHISGWQSPTQPGTRRCDQLNTMVYTYNQGVILSGLRGLWLATGLQDYLDDGHDLVLKVILATGWPNKTSTEWAGLGRGGVLEETCDSVGDCSQNGQTFKGIFFHHLAEFCRPLSPQEERFLAKTTGSKTGPGGQRLDDLRVVFRWHLAKCYTYRFWLEHNADAALVTRNPDGKFGMWWGRPYPGSNVTTAAEIAPLPAGAIDYRNSGDMDDGSRRLYGAVHGRRDGRGTRDVDNPESRTASKAAARQDVNDRGRGRTVETQSGGVAVLRALYQWKTAPSYRAFSGSGLVYS
ncbi:hypothetical protein VTN02DRAFT_4878 [Thermoascus thermophilus]